MNPVNYFIVTDDDRHEIRENTLDLILTLHQFLQGQSYAQLSITPATGEFDLDVPITGATHSDDIVTAPMTVHTLKRIQLDDRKFLLIAYTLEGNSEDENNTNI